MVNKFHRFVAPVYTNAPSLGAPPAGVVSFEGVDYDLFNVATGSVGGGGAAFMDGYKGAGPNAGTYAVAFGEDASSSNANRGMRALAENTDALDDLFHRDIAIPLVTTPAVAGAGVTSILLPVETFVGQDVSYQIDMLFSVVDGSDREIINPTTGAKISVASITGAAVGDGFSAGLVTLNLSEALPTGVTYKVYYSSRGNLATLPVDGLSYIRVRGAEEVSAEVERLLMKLHGGSQAWNANWDITINDLSKSVSTTGAYRLMEVPNVSGLSSLSLVGIAAGDLRLVTGVEYYGLYRYSAAHVTQTSWTARDALGGASSWIHMLHDVVGEPEGLATLDADRRVAERVRRVRSFSMISEMKAESVVGLSALLDEFCAVTIGNDPETDAVGFYFWDAASALPSDEPWVVVPDSVTPPDPGRWINSLWGMRGRPSRFASLDASSRLEQYPLNACVGFFTAQDNVGQNFGTGAGTFSDASGGTVGFGVGQVDSSDYVIVEVTLDIKANGAGDTGYARILVTEGGVDHVLGGAASYSTTSNTYVRVTLSGTYQATGGTISVKLQGANSNGPVNMTQFADFTMNVRVMRA